MKILDLEQIGMILPKLDLLPAIEAGLGDYSTGCCYATG
jgi:hypothetical protein